MNPTKSSMLLMVDQSAWKYFIEQILVVDQPVGFDDERDAKDFTVIAFQCSALVSQLLIGFAV